MSDYTVTVLEGPKLPSFRLIIKGDSIDLAELILVPHSYELYELHLSNVHNSIKGKTVEVSKATLKFIFKELKKIQKLIVTIPIHNRLAVRLAKQLMHYEGTISRSFLFDGIMEDQDMYGISRRGAECL